MLRNPVNNNGQHSNLPMMLLHVRETLLVALEPILNQYCLSNQQWRIMQALHKDRKLTEKELCNECQILTSGIAPILNRMASLELIEVHWDDSQQRIIKLTQHSHKIIEEITPILCQKYNEIESNCGSDTLNNLYNALNQVLHNNQHHHNF